MRINNMKLLKKGFTIAEMLVCFTVIGILASLLIPSIIYNKPNKNMAMVRKAYQITERAVSEMIMDDEMFPAEGDAATGIAYYDASANRIQKDTGKFFCQQFAQKLNVNGDIHCNNADGEDGGYYLAHLGQGSAATEGRESFTTNDGIHWYITTRTIICDPEDAVSNTEATGKCEFPDVSNGAPPCPAGAVKSPFICVYFDVNGSEAPNSRIATGNTYNATDNSDIKRADRGWFYVYWNGKIVVPRGQIERYLRKTDVFDN